MMRRLNFFIAVFFAMLTLPSLAQEVELGKHYTLVEPPLASSAPAGKIEVVEFFSYGCPHCADFHPIVNIWANKLPKDVSLRKVPVSFNRPAWARLAAMYYSMESSGDLAKLESALFKALHQERATFSDDQAFVTWAGGKGGDTKKISEALAGFGMQSRIRRGDQEATAARIGGVPAIVVGGRYLVNNSGANGYEDLLRITDALIAKARQTK
ncbi:MAG: thiol:disulfide interchange protein DsbA/DsbL [Rhodocyclaceae bacterium]|jgi:thiol:disulfide interchange protein DsbA|nr:thiol:disulfide interchange protein DsbA/DsbL [Rhodocyclaceae bacterium]MBK6906921.1 thiol:disulfide interchange protein DsbA/DsbL [Rhodocyclaceae bacterium]